MARESITAILIILTLLGCSYSSGSHSNANKSDTTEINSINFRDFVENMPSKNLPLTIECGFQTALNEKDFNKTYQQFIPEGFEVVGNLNVNKDMSLILFARIGDILYPYLFSYDNDGQKIDSIYLHISTCAGDPYLELSTWSVIDKNITINMTDTAKFFYYHENETEYFRRLDSTIVTKRIMQMDNTGRFIKITEKKKKNEIVAKMV
ncbi:MAG: hypothetical protein IH597_07750 [Bacteroidales bacterium]|nr:hypothetical protein [Bacteroidales bacterium]